MPRVEPFGDSLRELLNRQHILPANDAVPMRRDLARARLYEQLGEREGAMASHERFLTLGKDAEAPLQPQLREAREAWARLHDAGRRDAAGVAVKPTAR